MGAEMVLGVIRKTYNIIIRFVYSVYTVRLTIITFTTFNVSSIQMEQINRKRFVILPKSVYLKKYYYIHRSILSVTR